MWAAGQAVRQIAEAVGDRYLEPLVSEFTEPSEIFEAVDLADLLIRLPSPADGVRLLLQPTRRWSGTMTSLQRAAAYFPPCLRRSG